MKVIYVLAVIVACTSLKTMHAMEFGNKKKVGVSVKPFKSHNASQLNPTTKNIVKILNNMRRVEKLSEEELLKSTSLLYKATYNAQVVQENSDNHDIAQTLLSLQFSALALKNSLREQEQPVLYEELIKKGEGDSWRCLWENCEKSYSVKIRVREHIKSIHLNEPFYCPFGCLTPYTFHYSLEKHIETKHPEK